MPSCKFKLGDGWNCGSYAFNLKRDGIDQGALCDTHYWQTQATRLRADRDCEKRLRKDSDDRATDLAELLTKRFGAGWEDWDAGTRRSQAREIERLRAALEVVGKAP